MSPVNSGTGETVDGSIVLTTTSQSIFLATSASVTSINWLSRGTYTTVGTKMANKNGGPHPGL